MCSGTIKGITINKKEGQEGEKRMSKIDENVLAEEIPEDMSIYWTHK